MHLLVIAVLPAAVLMYVIYRYDKVEREPIGLLLAVMGLGMLTTIPAIIWEILGEKVLSLFFWEESLPFIFFDNFFSGSAGGGVFKASCGAVFCLEEKSI